MKFKIIFIIGIVIFTLAVAGFAIFTSISKKADAISSFEKCQDAGYLILETYPAQCKTPEGKTFTQVINPSRANFNEKVTLSSGKRTTFTDGLKITLVGINDSRCPKEAVCVWAGEITAQFNISGGKMSEEKEFRLGTVNVKSMSTGGYTFILKDANPKTATFTVADFVSDASTNTNIDTTADNTGTLPQENDDAQAPDAESCYIGGCSNEICSDKRGVVSNCLYKQEYVCYQLTKCERQQNGQCGWTQTPKFKACVADTLSSGQGMAQ